MVNFVSPADSYEVTSPLNFPNFSNILCRQNGLNGSEVMALAIPGAKHSKILQRSLKSETVSNRFQTSLFTFAERHSEHDSCSFAIPNLTVPTA